MQQHCVAWHGMAWHGMAWHGMAWHGMGIVCTVSDMDPQLQGMRAATDTTMAAAGTARSVITCMVTMPMPPLTPGCPKTPTRLTGATTTPTSSLVTQPMATRVSLEVMGRISTPQRRTPHILTPSMAEVLAGCRECITTYAELRQPAFVQLSCVSVT